MAGLVVALGWYTEQVKQVAAAEVRVVEPACEDTREVGVQRHQQSEPRAAPHSIHAASSPTYVYT